jgi:hypothetical protein
VSEARFYHLTLWSWVGLSVVTFVALLFMSAPYGKHTRAGWGPTISARWGWLLMESPAALVMPLLAIPALRERSYAQGWLLVACWLLHYVHRGFIYPFRIRSSRRMPLAVVAMAVVFNGMNGWLNARGITWFGPELGRVAVTHPRVLVGTALFLVGLAINWDADRRLFAMPRGSDGGYTIPRGGLFDSVTSPNYFGELVEWLGFAIAAGSYGALSFWLWTAANLVPRALSHRAWYRAQFPDYPPQRRAVIPGVL